MNIENAPKEIVKSVVDLANLVKELMDENQKLSVQLELERLFPSTRSGGRLGKSKDFHRVDACELSASTTTDANTGFATPSTTRRTIAEI